MDHDLIQLRVRSGEAHEAPGHLGEHLGQRRHVVVCRQREPVHFLAQQVEQMVNRSEPHGFLRGEVVIDLRLVGVDPLGDGPRRRAVEPLRPELDQRGVE
jgi:hypothetical protein